jgi:hypothetical protein
MRRLVAVLIAVGALAAAAVPGTAGAAKLPPGSTGSCGTNNGMANQPHAESFTNGISGQGTGGGSLQDCEPGPNP